jgi:hypothetical protein
VNARAIKANIVLFELTSRLKVNFYKSLLVGVNVFNSWMVIKASIVLNCKIGCIPLFIMTSRLAVI